MKKKRKKTTLKRKDRLNAGKKWVKIYPGKNFVRGYKKKFKVDTLCALSELEILGVKLDPEYIKSVTESEEARKAVLQARNLRRKEKEELFDSDETFSFIAGYTSGGAPFGIRWDEEDSDEDFTLPF